MYNIAFGIIISLLVVSLVILFCVILIKLYIQKIKKYNQIIYQKEIEHQVKLNQSMLESQEQTLQHISQELHDDAGQQLTYINFQLEHLKLDYPHLNSTIQPVSNTVIHLSNSIRQLSHSLNNQILSQQDVIKAIEIEANRLNKDQKIKFDFHNHIKENIHFSSLEKIVMYRIFQESINNIFKHSKATVVIIELNKNPSFKMTITDNGVGFAVENELKQTKSNGLQNIISRAEIIDFEIKINSEIGNGSTLTLNKKTNE